MQSDMQSGVGEYRIAHEYIKELSPLYLYRIDMQSGAEEYRIAHEYINYIFNIYFSIFMVSYISSCT